MSKKYTNWNAINLKPVNHAPTLIPKLHVSLRTSNAHNNTHNNIANAIRFINLPQLWSFLMSMSAIAMSNISSNSLYDDIGIPDGNQSLKLKNCKL